MAARYKESFYLEHEFLFSTEEIFAEDPDETQVYHALRRAYTTRAKFALAANRHPDSIEIRVIRTDPPGQGELYANGH